MTRLTAVLDANMVIGLAKGGVSIFSPSCTRPCISRPPCPRRSSGKGGDAPVQWSWLELSEDGSRR